jgi:hypothetical protein
MKDININEIFNDFCETYGIDKMSKEGETVAKLLYFYKHWGKS